MIRRLLTISLLSTLLLPAGAFAADKVTCYTLWDDYFFYAAFEVQDPDIVSTNTTHMSKPWEDDCIEVFLETDAKRAPNRTPNTYQMSVSAGGGSSFSVGENGEPKMKTIFTFKYAKRVQGTINQPNDKDIGYTIELAIPWKEMGGPPKIGQVMGFNILCRMKGENEGFVSLSPNVAGEADVNCPAKWGSVKFTNTPTIIAMENGVLICRRVADRGPVMNGNLSPGEWIRDMRIQIAKPEPTIKRPEQFMIEKLALTHYFYWYQGDSRKESPAGHVRIEDGSSELTDQPLDGVGPWFSYDRVQWHKDQFTQIRNAGIDVVIPVYWGDAQDRRWFADKGLNCMVQALKELKAEGKSYPLVGMFFDTSAMNRAYGGQNPDVKSDEVKETFYGMIKDFFLNVPDEFRAVVQTPAEKGGYPANIVVLYTASWFSDLDASFTDFCNKRFMQDFGRRLIWLGSSDYREKAPAMDGYTDYGAGLGFRFDDKGWIDIAGIGAGYDDSSQKGREKATIRSRMSGNAYRKGWDSAMAASPDWLVIDGWNELHEGSEICPSVQYGESYIGLTKINMLRFNGMRPYDAKFLKHDTPAVMLPGAMYQVTLTIKNAGTKPWYPGVQGVFLTGRWFKEGTLFADTAIRLPFQETVLAGQIVRKTIGIRTVDQDGKSLPEGDYELRFEMVRSHDEWFSGDTPLRVPVKVGQPDPGFTLVGSTLPTLMKSGATYNVTIRVRNDGPTAWKAGWKIGYGWHKASVHLGKDSEDVAESAGANESAAVIQTDVEPGRIAEVTLSIAANLPVWTQNDLWTYLLRWDVFDGQKWLPTPGAWGATESVKVTATDYGPRFMTSDTPSEMNAGKKLVVNLTLENRGVETWTKADYAVGYHWYSLDGLEVQWDGAKTPLPADVLPGQQVAVKASVTPPAYDGQYYLVWDLAAGDKWASTTANTRGSDILVVPVKVVKGSLVTVDLSKSFDADVISYDTNRKDGDAGGGLTLPAEFLPPNVSEIAPDGKLWPSGLWASAKGIDQSKRISFLYPPKTDGAKNAITCNGQTIDLKPGKYSSAHLLVLAAEKTTGEFGLAYSGSKAGSKADFNAWSEPPVRTAFVCLHRHSPDGDQPNQPCYLADYSIPTDPKAELTSITLPKNPAIRIMAITLEKAS